MVRSPCRNLLRSGLLGLCIACSSSTEVPSTEVRIESPPLEQLEARQLPFRFRGNWGMLVTARLGADGATLAPNARVPLHVATTAGDAEELLLRPRVCESQTG